MRIRFLPALLLIVALFAAACSSSGDASDAGASDAAAGSESAPVEAPPATAEPAPEPTAAQAEESAEQVETPVINVGVNAEFEPFVYVDTNGNLAGFDIDLMNALNAEMDFEVAYTNTSFEALFDGLESGELDAAVSAITVTDARRDRVDFTTPYFAAGLSPVSYFSAGQGLATRTDNQTITGVDSLTADVTVGVKQGTTGSDFVVANTGATAVPFAEAEIVLQALVNGDVDAVVLDTPVIIRFIKANPGAALKLVGGPLTEETYAIAVNKERPLVLDGLNQGLDKLIQDGTYDVIYNKWFGAP